MAKATGSYEETLGLLTAKANELHERTAGLRTFVRPDFDLHAFHTHFDPVLEAAEAAHDLYHALLHQSGHGH